VSLFTSTKRYLYLYKVAPEVNGGRDEGKASLINLALELFDFCLVGKQPTVPQRFMVVDIPVGIGLYGKSYKSEGIVGDRHITIRKAKLAIPDGFDLSAYQGDTTLKVLNDLIVEIGFSVFL